MRARLALLWCCLACAAGAGPLAEPPLPWSDRVAALPEQRLDELDAASTARIRETRAHLDTLLAAADTDPLALAAVYGRLGALYAAQRLFAGAELALHNARALDPQGFQWAYYAAHVALLQGEAAQALDALEAATRLDATYAPLALRRGEALLGLNRLAEARAAYARAAEDPGLHIAGQYGLGQIDLLERDWASAAVRLGEVLAAQPDADAVHYPLGQALLRLDRRDEARAQLAQRGTRKPHYPDPLVDELRALQSGARRHFEQGVSAVKRLDYAAAAEAFAAGLAEQPDNVRARTSLARALWLSGQRDTATSELHRAIADDPGQTLPRFLLAVCEDAAGDAVAARADYTAVLEIDPGHEGALSYLANLDLRAGDHAAAAARFERAITAGVTQTPVFMHYWLAQRRAGTADATLRDQLAAFDRRFPEPPVFRSLLARLLASAGDPEVRDPGRALEIARALYAMQPIPMYAELVAMALAARGDFAEAQRLQQDLIEMARIGGAWIEATALEANLAAYRDRTMPPATAAWATVDAMLMPPQADPEAVMRNYPAGQPF